MKKIMVSVIAGLLLGTFAYADGMDLPHVAVFGTAKTDVTPDLMVWSLRIQNKGMALEKVAEQHTGFVKRVLKFLKEAGVEAKHIQTSRMQFGENWIYRDRSRVKEGYIASTSLSFKLMDLKHYERLWMGLSRFDRVSVQGARYDHTERIKHQNETREKALLAAREKAERLAKTLGSEIGEPLVIEEDLSVSEGSGAGAGSAFTNRAVNVGGAGRGGEGFAPGKIPIQIRVKAKFRLITPGK